MKEEINFNLICDNDNSILVSKKGKDYINSLKLLFDLKNKNDFPFLIDDIKNQPTIEDFKFSGINDFQKVCQLKARPLTIKDGKRKNETILVDKFYSSIGENIYKKDLGAVYIITCPIENKEHIIKIGMTRTTMEKRIQSYNCGTVKNWRTASTTNFKILQSMVATRIPFNLYLYSCGETTTIIWHNIESIPLASQKAIAVEDILVKQFIKQFNKKPLANVQTNATEVK